MTRPNANLTDTDLGYPTEANGRIPSFKSRDEEAAFWASHDLTEFMGDELQPVEAVVKGELAERLTVRLDQEDRRELERQARELGVGPSTLVRMWVKERLSKTA